jgi:Cu+-exporting ATPase
MKHNHQHAHVHDSGEVDPVCGMAVDPAHAAGSSRIGDRTFYFCSISCKQKFNADPAAYTNGKRPEPKPAPTGAMYVCPMDPEVRQDKPGACPKCGMALEPDTVRLQEEQNPELTDMTRRFWVSTALTVPLVIFAMLRHLPGSHDLLGHTLTAWAPWIELALATPVVMWGGLPFFERAWA